MGHARPQFTAPDEPTRRITYSSNPATSPDARARVTEAATALGYRPNAQARSLRLTRTHVLGLLVSDVLNPFFADIAHAAEQAALDADYVSLLGNANENVDQQDRYIETFLTQRVDGVVLALQGPSATLDTLLSSRMPLVFVDRKVEGFDVPSVTTDSRLGLDQAVAHLVAAGHRRIGYIGGPQSISTGRERHDAFIDALQRQGFGSRPRTDHLRGVFVGFVGLAGVLATAETWGPRQRAEVDALIRGDTKSSAAVL